MTASDPALAPRIVSHGPLALVAIVMPTSTAGGRDERDIPAFWQRSVRDGVVERLAKAMPGGSLGLLGICVDKPGAGGGFAYAIGIEAPADRSTLPADCVDIAVPAGTWAVFTAVGALPASLQSLMPRIFAEWLPGSGYVPDGPLLEVYPEGEVASADYRCEIRVAVRRAG
jgi:AraC family transcriptional regulator